MKCPHCLVEVHEKWSSAGLGRFKHAEQYKIESMQCPACLDMIATIQTLHLLSTPSGAEWTSANTILVWPRTPKRAATSQEVPQKYACDYNEACDVLPISPKASAALSRRCLQHILKDELNIDKYSLDGAIQEVLDEKLLPAYLQDDLDYIRHIGNFAAHTEKSEKTGEILGVEPGEADWSLIVLEALMEEVFVKPAISKAKKAALNAKLKDSGAKKLMKEPKA